MREDSNSAKSALLAGLRLVSARPTVLLEPGLVRLHDALRAHGATVENLPLMYVDMLMGAHTWEPTATELASYTWVCVTSGEAVFALARALSPHGLNIQRVQVAAVGDAAGHALDQLGWAPVVNVPAASTITPASAPAVSAKIVEALLNRDDVDGAKILLLCSEELAAPLETSLAALGMIVTAIPVSRLTPDHALPSTLWSIVSEHVADMFLVTSPSAIDLLSDAVVPERTRHFPMVCIGKQTARAARAAGFPVHVEVEYANAPVLVRALAAVWNAR